MLITTPTRLGLKVTVIGQGQGQGSGLRSVHTGNLSKQHVGSDKSKACCRCSTCSIRLVAENLTSLKAKNIHVTRCVNNRQYLFARSFDLLPKIEGVQFLSTCCQTARIVRPIIAYDMLLRHLAGVDEPLGLTAVRPNSTFHNNMS